MLGLEMRKMEAEARDASEKKSVLAKEIVLAKQRLRGDERCEAQNVTNEADLAMRRLGA
jgi:hypothetical protein